MSKAKLAFVALCVFIFSAIYSSWVAAEDMKDFLIEDSICDDLNPRNEEELIKRIPNIISRKTNKLFV